jgi:hypothetical protein
MCPANMRDALAGHSASERECFVAVEAEPLSDSRGP